MRKIASLVLAAALPLSLLAAGQAADDPPEGINHMVEVAVGTTEQVQAAGGTGGTNLLGDSEGCASTSYTATCEKTLALFAGAGTAAIQVTPKYPSDYDLVIWLSDETGAMIEEVGGSESYYNPLAPNEEAELEVKSGEYYVLVVTYFAGGGGYFMNVGLA